MIRGASNGRGLPYPENRRADVAGSAPNPAHGEGMASATRMFDPLQSAPQRSNNRPANVGRGETVGVV